MVWKLTRFTEQGNKVTRAPYDVRGEWSDSTVLQAAQKVKAMMEQHENDNPAASLMQAIEIIKEFLPDPIRDVL